VELTDWVKRLRPTLHKNWYFWRRSS